MNNEATAQSTQFAPAIPQGGGEALASGVAQVASAIPSAVSILPDASKSQAANDTIIAQDTPDNSIIYNTQHIAANHNHAHQEADKSLEEIIEENPHFRLMQERLQSDMEVMKEISHVLQSLFANGAEHHLEAHEKMSIVNDVFALAAKYQHNKATNPTISISTLTSQIGSGSAFYHKANNFIISQHPENDESHPEHPKNKKHTKPDNHHHWLHLPQSVQGFFHHGSTPSLQVSANDHQYDGTVALEPQMAHANHNN